MIITDVISLFIQNMGKFNSILTTYCLICSCARILDGTDDETILMRQPLALQICVGLCEGTNPSPIELLGNGHA